jgi:hypothetical protein
LRQREQIGAGSPTVPLTIGATMPATIAATPRLFSAVASSVIRAFVDGVNPAHCSPASGVGGEVIHDVVARWVLERDLVVQVARPWAPPGTCATAACRTSGGLLRRRRSSVARDPDDARSHHWSDPLSSLSARSSRYPGEPARHQQLPKLSNDSGVEVLLPDPQIGDHGHSLPGSREDATDGVHGRAVADEADFGSG